MRRLALALFIIAILLLVTAIWRTDDAHENAPSPSLQAVRDSIRFRLRVPIYRDSTARAEDAKADSALAQYHRERVHSWSMRRSAAWSA